MTPCILVVNDDEDIVAMLREVLTFIGYEVATRTTPDDILADVEAVDPDAIIIDWMFGQEERGTQIIELLKATPATHAIPLIVCSAPGSHLEVREAELRQQGVRVLYKPFPFSKLQSMLVGLVPL